MRKSSSSLFGSGATVQSRLRILLGILVLLNAVGLYFYFDPPGGSQSELTAQDQQLTNQLAAMRNQDARIKSMANRIQTGSDQITQFEKDYFLPKRIAYSAVISEIEQMAKEAGLQARDAGFVEEPIEGSTDLSLMNIKANYEGSYASFTKFLHATDKSKLLLMLDSVTAAPEKNGDIIADIRFQAVIQDRAPDTAKSQEEAQDHAEAHEQPGTSKMLEARRVPAKATGSHQ